MTERLRLRLVVPVLAGLLFAVPAGAQSPATPSDASDRPARAPSLTRTEVAESGAFAPAIEESRQAAAVAAPSLEGLRAGVRAPVARDEARTTNAVTMQSRGLSQAEVLMIVGGAAFLAGAIIGDDAGTIIMLGGAGIGLWGLYLYLQ